jgi:hypothetical protein
MELHFFYKVIPLAHINVFSPIFQTYKNNNNSMNFSTWIAKL